MLAVKDNANPLNIVVHLQLVCTTKCFKIKHLKMLFFSETAQDNDTIRIAYEKFKKKTFRCGGGEHRTSISIFWKALKKNCINSLKGWEKPAAGYSMEISSDKSKILSTASNQGHRMNGKMSGVDQFKYLASTQTQDVTPLIEVKFRQAQAHSAIFQHGWSVAGQSSQRMHPSEYPQRRLSLSYS